MDIVRSRCRRLPWAFALFVAFLAGPRTLSPAAAQANDPASVGQWGPAIPWPCVAINLVMLPTGKVMFWPRDGEIHSWDPISGAIATVAWPGYNIFCTGQSLLADGRMLLAGGAVVDGQGLPYASIYNPYTDSWSRLANMNAGRWYPTCTTLADGSALVVSGSMSPSFEVNDLPQVWNGNGAWRDLTSARTTLPLYPFMFLAPNGKVFNPGPNTITRYLDTFGTGAWTNLDSRSAYRDYGSAVLYDNGKVVLVGGGDPPTNTAEVIDLNAANPTWRSVASMASPRRHGNATLLPDGKVLMTGGISGPGFSNRDTPVFAAEMWDPSTESWSRMASQAQPRWYHSTAILLPDGRVVSAGGDDTLNAEVYSPPYLFKGARPTIAAAPVGANYGDTFFVGTPQADSITKVHFLRLGSATHAFNMDQRINRLSFTRVAGGLNVTAPSSNNLAPPGYYMLFLLNGSGVPSVAKIMRLGGTPPSPPNGPTSLTATTASNTQVYLAWTDNSGDEDGFAIERSTDGVSFTIAATVSANVTSYLCTGLTASTSYRFRVYAYKGTSPSPYSPIATATTAANPPTSTQPPPLAPSNLAATGVSTRQINLSWTDNSGEEEGFAIERSTDGATFAQVATVVAGVTSVPNTALAAATTYYYRIRAYRGSLYSAYSAVASATTLTDARISPSAPVSLAATAVSGSQINLTWGDGSSDEDGFNIERSADGTIFTLIATVGANVVSYASTDLAPGTAYWFRVRSFRGISSSAYSPTATATTVANGPPPPTAPSNLRATPLSTQQITLTWSDNSSDEEGFAIERSTDGTVFTPVATVAANVTSYVNGGLDAATSYWYRVRAYRGTSFSAFTPVAAATTAPRPPSAPANLTATASSSSQIDLSWMDNSGDESGFTIERWPDGATFTPIATVGANVTSYASSGLAPGTTYYYRVYATGSGGNSDYSNRAQATTMAVVVTLPAAPSSLMAVPISTSQVSLSWRDNSGDESGFVIERSSGGGAFTPVATVGSNVTTFTDGTTTPLAAATNYSYRIRAQNAAGVSAPTNTVNVTTASSGGRYRPPATPTTAGSAKALGR